MEFEFIAHQRETDGKVQTVYNHLNGVSSICSELTTKLGLPEVGKIIGLLHDFGKYSNDFQTYIRSATGILNPDIDDDYVNAENLKGKIDHSTAGAQWIWERLGTFGMQGKMIAQILAVCLSSHHGGLIDCLHVDGTDGFQKRIAKDHSKSHFLECINSCDKEMADSLERLASKHFVKEFWDKIISIVDPKKIESDRIKHFRIGFFTRFLFSCLIDADRIDSADFENPINKSLRASVRPNWQLAIARLEAHLSSLTVRNQVDIIRNRISNQCLKKAYDPQGIYTLTVPTGGGKTFASIRYALHHAEKYNLDHIYYIIPYTSIIEQNSQVIRDVLEKNGDKSPWILEHHSNIEPENQTWRIKLSSENWNAPIIFTTMVQFLESMFGGGTRGVRRLHNLARSVIIFDEIQSLPVKCVHLFCNGLNFLTEHAGSTAILCTATQPLLNGVAPEYGALKIPDENELVEDVSELFDDLKRVEIVPEIRNGGWQEDDIADLALKQLETKGNCLVVVNTKVWAQNLFACCQSRLHEDGVLYHLSTSLCPAHRKKILSQINERLDAGLPVLCISTQLIEAGVDVDFNAVIRFLAGLDSIAQAAGRCNRNGNHDTSRVYVINPSDEPIRMLDDIRIGRDKAQRVLSEQEHQDFLGPQAMNRYFSYYFYERSELMKYPLDERQAGRKDFMVNLLTNNPLNIRRQAPDIATFRLRQSFKTAGRAFAAIDAPTRSVIVPYDKGKDIIARLCADFAPSQAYGLLKQAQKYSVNLFPNTWKKLVQEKAVHAVQEGEDIFYLDERYYSDYFGVSTEAVTRMVTPII